MSNFALYHWAPKSRRKQITRYGLRPHSLSSDLLWKPPYMCFADSPKLAWNLIGRFRPLIREWDLWWTSSDAVGGYEIIPDDDGGVREYRVYGRVFKRYLWMVGSRLNESFTDVELAAGLRGNRPQEDPQRRPGVTAVVAQTVEAAEALAQELGMDNAKLFGASPANVFAGLRAELVIIDSAAQLEQGFMSKIRATVAKTGPRGGRIKFVSGDRPGADNVGELRGGTV